MGFIKSCRLFSLFFKELDSCNKNRKPSKSQCEAEQENREASSNPSQSLLQRVSNHSQSLAQKPGETAYHQPQSDQRSNGTFLITISKEMKMILH
jgi:hypothetical protein